jgi:hypothetical protein
MALEKSMMKIPLPEAGTFSTIELKAFLQHYLEEYHDLSN